MSEPTTEAGRRLLDFIDAAIENTTNGVSWRNGAGYARVCAASSIPAIEREAYAKVRAAVEGLGTSELERSEGGNWYLDYRDVLAAIDALMEKNDGR